MNNNYANVENLKRNPFKIRNYLPIPYTFDYNYICYYCCLYTNSSHFKFFIKTFSKRQLLLVYTLVYHNLIGKHRMGCGTAKQVSPVQDERKPVRNHNNESIDESIVNDLKDEKNVKTKPKPKTKVKIRTSEFYRVNILKKLAAEK